MLNRFTGAYMQHRGWEGGGGGGGGGVGQGGAGVGGGMMGVERYVNHLMSPNLAYYDVNI